MGVWAETCAISHLPIPLGTRARMVLLFRSPDDSEDVHSGYSAGHALWTPWALPIPGTYDGYGRLQLETPDWHLGLLLDRITADVVDKSPKGPKLQEFTGPPVLMRVQELVTAGCLRVRAAINPDEAQAMGLCFIREDVYTLLANSPVYTDTAVFTVKDRAERVLADLKETKVSPLHTGALNDAIAKLADTDIGESLQATLTNLLRYRRLAEAMAGYGPTGFRGIGTYRLALSERIMAGESADHPHIDEAVINLATFEHILLHFEQLRLLWGPQNGAGSQTTGWESHIVLGRFISDTALREFESDMGMYEDPTPVE